MKIQSVFDPAFAPYGHVLKDYDLTEFLKVLSQQEKPANAVVYVPGCDALEALPVATELQNRAYGGMPIQIGYCNGNNTKLNCLEYHKDSEINIPVEDTVLLLAKMEHVDFKTQTLDTSNVEAFLVPGGTAVEVYATSLHYAPCNGHAEGGFQVAIVLPKGTNIDKPAIADPRADETWMTARNKWLIAHEEASEASQTPARLTGANIDIAADI